MHITKRSWLLALGAIALPGCGGERAPAGAPDAGDPADGGGCAPGEIADATGCIAAGIPEDACGDGFEPDGARGCRPVLPPDPCGPGQTALPGDGACHEIAACGSGTWGDIETDATTEFVDGSYAGGNSDGSMQKPWTTIQDGIDAATGGGTVAIAEGSYVENVELNSKTITLWGRCPALVAIRGTVANKAALAVVFSGATVRSLAVTGSGGGILVSGGKGAALRDVWIHDTASGGVHAQDDLGATSVTLSNMLIESTHELGIWIKGTEADISDVEVRGTGASSQKLLGRGIAVEDHVSTRRRSTATIRRAVFDENTEVGLYVAGSDVTIDGVVVRRTRPSEVELTNGRGIGIEDDTASGQTATVSILHAFVEQNHDVGIYVAGSAATIEASVVRSTLERASNGIGGRGINVEIATDSLAPATATIKRCLVDDNKEGGIDVIGAGVTIESTIVRGTQPATDGLFGDGLGATAYLADATVSVVGSRIERSARAGIANFGSSVTLASDALECNALSLDGEEYDSKSSVYADQGGNACSCDGGPSDCKVLSAQLEPPQPLGI